MVCQSLLARRKAEAVRVTEALSAVANRPAVRGQASTPAIVMGNQMGIDPSKPFEVTEDNRSVTVIVDNISAQIQLATGQYSVGDFVTELENRLISWPTSWAGRCLA